MTWKNISRARERLAREQGAIVKDWGGRLPVALVYPNSYYIGMSNLGVHVLYRLFNQYSGVVCERVFCDSDANVPVSLESQRPLGDFAILAVSFSFELDYLNLVAMLRRSGIPLSSETRGEGQPILIAGGPCVMANPQPLASLIDAFAIGEGEVIVPSLVETLLEGADLQRDDLLRRIAMLPGLYVPRFHDLERDDGRAVDMGPIPGAPHAMQRQWLPNLDDQPAHSVIIADDTEFGDMYLMEVTRGCGRGCHFCLAGVAYSPVREGSLEVLLDTAKKGLAYRQTLGLIGASLSDYSQLESLARGLRRLGAKLSVASLRVDPLPIALLEALSESGARTVTIAPEAGSERLRRKIRKGISSEDIMRAVELIACHEFPHLKLYFMIGLPTEDDSDVREIVELLRGVRKRFHRHITVNITPFVPKAQTPFERTAMASRRVLEHRFEYLRDSLRSLNVETTGESPRRAEVQAVLARGDRPVGEALMALDGTGLPAWRRALEATGLSSERYLASRAKDEILPWPSITGQTCLRESTMEMASQGAS
ncbi:MAG: radical SAM protein [Anaerolineae bacterium]